MPRIPPFDQLFSEDEIQKLRGLYVKSRRVHPLVSVALHPGPGQHPNLIAINTTRALGYVLPQFPGWVQGLKSRLLDEKDWTNAESALAEIRACGDLLRAGFPVRLGVTNVGTGAKAEFHVTLEGEKTIIEVWTRNLSKAELKGIKAQQTTSTSTHNVQGATITTTVASVTPFGRPDSNKKGDSILTNVISRVAAIKEREHQAHDRCPFVIWADLQSVESMRFDYSSHLQPLMSWNGSLESGGYWHALYGRKGDIVLEMDTGRTRANTMLHDGRFKQRTKNGERTRVSAFVFSSSKVTAIMENPSAPFPLTTVFRRHLIDLPRFEIGLSLANWSDGLVARTVAAQREMIAGVIETLGLSQRERSVRERCFALIRRWIMIVVGFIRGSRE